MLQLAYPKVAQPKIVGLSASNLPLIPIPHPARMPDYLVKAKEVYAVKYDKSHTVVNFTCSYNINLPLCKQIIYW